MCIFCEFTRLLFLGTVWLFLRVEAKKQEGIILTKLPTTCVYGAGILADSLKSHQEWTSVWRAKCKEFVKKIKDFRSVQCGRFGGIAEIAPRVAPSMDSKM